MCPSDGDSGVSDPHTGPDLWLYGQELWVGKYIDVLLNLILQYKWHFSKKLWIHNPPFYNKRIFKISYFGNQDKLDFKNPVNPNMLGSYLKNIIFIKSTLPCRVRPWDPDTQMILNVTCFFMFLKMSSNKKNWKINVFKTHFTNYI